MKTKKIIHKGWKEYQKIKDRAYKKEFKCLFGKYQYLLSSKRGEISLVELKDYHQDGQDIFEIYCLKGKLFEDTPRFKTLKQAKAMAENYLDKEKDSWVGEK